MPPPRLEVPFVRYHLENGLAVILHEDHSLPMVTTNLWFRVGSKDEAPGRTGFAHLFEHLMFMGTAGVPTGQFDEIMEAWGGSNNATTSEERTNYFDVGPSNLLATFLWLEADRLATLPDAMTAKKVALQRDVVKNERRQSNENRPYGAVELVVPGEMFPPGHPYHHPVIGSHADLNAASVDDVRSFFRAFYTPSNASLVIAGDFDQAEAKKLVDRYFGWMPKLRVPSHKVAPPASLDKPKRIEINEDVNLDRVDMVWHSPALRAQGDAETEVLGGLLGGGRGSRLYRRLVVERGVASNVEVKQNPMQYGGLFWVTVTGAKGHRAAEIEAELRRELTALVTSQPPTDVETARARAFVERVQLEELDGLIGRADGLNQYESLFGDPGALSRDHLARYAAVGASDVAWQARVLLTAPELTVITQKKPKK
jgi:zinc protease